MLWQRSLFHRGGKPVANAEVFKLPALAVDRRSFVNRDVICVQVTVTLAAAKKRQAKGDGKTQGR
jgi:hypothetical protein